MSAKLGTCASCKQEMIQTDTDCWHPRSTERSCPPEIFVNGHWIAAWGSIGRPGRDFFIEDSTQPEPEEDECLQPKLF